MFKIKCLPVTLAVAGSLAVNLTFNASMGQKQIDAKKSAVQSQTAQVLKRVKGSSVSSASVSGARKAEQASSDDKGNIPGSSTSSYDTQKRIGPVKGTMLKQVSDWRGAMRVELCKYGGRILTGDIVGLVKPNGDAYFLNTSSKIYAPIDKKNWKKNMGLVAEANSRETITYKGEEQMFGLKVSHYETLNENPEKDLTEMDPVAAKARAGARGKKPVIPKRYSFSFRQHIWTSTDFGLPKSFILQCGRVVMMPDGVGLPMRIIRSNDEKAVLKEKEKWKAFMDTQKVEKNVTLYASDFELPKSYRRVKSEIEVMMGEELNDL